MAFYNFFILGCFKQGRFMKTSTLYHVLKGKRTSSILSYGFFYDVIPFFGLLPTLNEKEYEKIIDKLKDNQFLIEKDGYSKLTPNGCEYLSQLQMPQTNSIHQLKYYRWDLSFFDRLLFTSQVISEKAHRNTHYLPIETNFYKQLQLKNWLKHQNQESDLAHRFYEEWHLLIKNLTCDEQDLILSQLVGHEIRGLTLRQIALRQNKDSFFVFLSFKNTWHKLLKIIIEEKKRFPLVNELLQIELMPYQSDTRNVTLHLFKTGHSIEQITQIRKLKIGTITDHLIDDYLITRNPRYMPIFSEDTILGFDQLLKNKPSFYQWTYQDALLVCPNISFYEYRFFQFQLKEKELGYG